MNYLSFICEDVAEDTLLNNRVVALDQLLHGDQEIYLVDTVTVPLLRRTVLLLLLLRLLINFDAPSLKSR